MTSLLLALSLSFPVLAGPVTIALACRDEAPCAVRGNATFRSVADPSVTRSLPIAGNRVTFAADAGTEWEVSVAAAGFWAPSVRWTAERPQTVRLWRTGRVHAVIQAKEKLTAVRLAVTSPPDPRRAPEIPQGTSFDCSSASASEWSCDVPATTLDVAIRAEGYAPHYLWDAKVPAGGTLRLGEVTLQKGGSLLAWLDPETLGRLDQPVKAILRRESLPAPSATAMRVSEPLAEATFSKKGVAHLSPLPAGRYVLEARAEGHVPAQLNVEVYEGKESAVRRPIELHPAVTVRLRIEPALAPDGVPWQLELWRRVPYGSGSEKAGGGAASQEGLFEAKNQAEGPLRVVLYDGKRNVLDSRELTIAAGGGDSTLTLHPIALEGTVKIGGNALPRASLLFGGSGGAQKIRVKADEEGRFTVTLPRAGEWPVDVTASAESVATTARVTVADGDQSVAIDLPAGELSGWVRDSSGQRLAGARVELFAGGGVLSRVTDAEGVFRFRGVPAGALSVRATDPRNEEYSPESRVTMADGGGRIENVELKIESLRSIHGFVRSGGVAVPGARVNAYALLGGTAQQERVTTDLQGRFALDIPLASATVTLVVGVAGRTLHPFTVVPVEQGVEVDVAPRGGELRLRWPAGTRPIRIVFNDGVFLPLPDLMEWARAQGRAPEGGGVVVPNVAPGRYQMCTGPACTAGTLAIGGNVELDLTPLLTTAR
ncbi:MAG TPA: carboxypeptidase-like regulatory domain-containing protein [Thermoanaerobaculia bacterium]|nr:carboxypeptidase-like regulatory domain-containing protein [Thermoanaerobaculia bacterium]